MLQVKMWIIQFSTGCTVVFFASSLLTGATVVADGIDKVAVAVSERTVTLPASGAWTQFGQNKTITNRKITETFMT